MYDLCSEWCGVLYYCYSEVVGFVFGSFVVYEMDVVYDVWCDGGMLFECVMFDVYCVLFELFDMLGMLYLLWIWNIVLVINVV